MNITIPKGFKIGHAQDEYSGVTAILCPKGAIGGVDCRGGGPGTRETDLLHPEKMMNTIHSVVLTGGSAYGLGSTQGVMEYLKDQGVGYKVGSKIVPIVCGAVIYDLNQKEYHYPTAKMGYEACENAEKPLEFGNVGVGRGATVGKIRGLKYACKSGVGAATVKVCGMTVTAVIAVNAMGDIRDPETGKIIAGAKNKEGNFIDTEKCILNGEYMKLLLGTNTTIGCILTDAKINKVQANKLASVGHNGYARVISPVHTDYDGDTLFCLSSGHRPVANFVLLQTACVKAVEDAILNAINENAENTILFDDDESNWECE